MRRCKACDTKVQRGPRFKQRGDYYCRECVDIIAEEAYGLKRRGLILYGLSDDIESVDKGFDDDTR